MRGSVDAAVPDRLDSGFQAPLLEALAVTMAKTDFTWPWRKLCKQAWLRVLCLHVRHAFGKQKSTAGPQSTASV